MRDKSLGTLLFALFLICAFLYVYWLFYPAPKSDGLFYYDGVRWAIVLPILAAVLAVVFIGMWIGWTMAVTPPPISLEDEKLEKEKEEETEEHVEESQTS